MVVKAQPPQLKPPASLVRDNEARTYFRQMHRYMLDTWYQVDKALPDAIDVAAATTTTIATPSVPTGVGINASDSAVVIYWDTPTYSGHWYTKVYRTTWDGVTAPAFSETYALNLKASGSSYMDQTVSPDTWYIYWLRHVNLDSTESDLADSAGHTVQTSEDWTLDSGWLDEFHITTLFGDRIDAIDTTLLDGELGVLGAYDALKTAHDILDSATDVRLTVLESSTQPLLGSWSGSQAINNNTTITGASDFTISSASATTGTIRIKVTDSLDSFSIGINGVLISDDYAGVTDDSVWYSFDAVTIASGNNEINVWSTDSDQPTVTEIELREGAADYESRIIDLETTSGDHATKLSSLGTYSGGSFATIDSLQTTSDDNATDITALTTRVGDNESDITTLNSTTSSQATSLTNLQTQADGNSSDVTTLNTTTATHASMFTALGTYTTAGGGSFSTILNLETTTAANASSLSSLTTSVGSNTSSISALDTTTSNQATSISQLETTASSHTASINANASDISDNTSDISTNTSSITTLNTTTANQATSITQLQTTSSSHTTSIADNATAISTNTSSISTLNTTTASQATSISQLVTTSGDNESAITTLSNTVDDNAIYTIRVETNGNIAGIGIESTDTATAMLFTADKIGFTNGTDDVLPFSIVDGIVYMTEARINTVEANSIANTGSGTAILGDTTIQGDFVLGQAGQIKEEDLDPAFKNKLEYASTVLSGGSDSGSGNGIDAVGETVQVVDPQILSGGNAHTVTANLSVYIWGTPGQGNYGASTYEVTVQRSTNNGSSWANVSGASHTFNVPTGVYQSKTSQYLYSLDDSTSFSLGSGTDGTSYLYRLRVSAVSTSFTSIITNAQIGSSTLSGTFSEPQETDGAFTIQTEATALPSTTGLDHGHVVYRY